MKAAFVFHGFSVLVATCLSFFLLCESHCLVHAREGDPQFMELRQNVDYSVLDGLEITQRVFHPRFDPRRRGSGGGETLTIPVSGDVVLDARFHMAHRSAPNILFFHGNGEIVSDYDDLGPLYVQKGINFMIVDYRGYGHSTGTPSVSAMMRDSLSAMDFFLEYLKKGVFTGPVVVMGRSLGSACALELATQRSSELRALIIESGFAQAIPLLELLGVNVSRFGLKEENAFGNLQKISRYRGPLLIIHAEKDHIIPYSEAVALYEACPSQDKTLVRIPRANHNDIFHYGLADYMNAVVSLVTKIR